MWPHTQPSASKMSQVVSIHNYAVALLQERHLDDAIHHFTTVLAVAQTLIASSRSTPSVGDEGEIGSDGTIFDAPVVDGQTLSLDNCMAITHGCWDSETERACHDRDHHHHHHHRGCRHHGQLQHLQPQPQPQQQPHQQCGHRFNEPPRQASSQCPKCQRPNCQRPFVYVHPIPLPSTLRTSYRAAVFISITTMFNLALCYHQAASFTAHASEEEALQSTQKAVKMYQLAHKLHCEEAGLGQSDVFFSMAITNNLGVIYETHGRRDVSTGLFQNVLATLMLIVDQRGLHGNHQGYDNMASSFDGLIRNTSSLASRGEQAAAAAA